MGNRGTERVRDVMELSGTYKKSTVMQQRHVTAVGSTKEITKRETFSVVMKQNGRLRNKA